MTFNFHLYHLLITAATGGLVLCLLCKATTLPIPETNQTLPTYPTIPLVSSPPSTQGAPWLEQPEKEKAVEGEDVVFACQLRDVIEEKMEMEVEWIEWQLQSAEEKKLVFKGNETVNGRAFLSGNLTQGDLSMTLKNVTVEDRGVYVCVLTLRNSVVLQGGGTKLSVREDLGLEQESVGTTIGIAVAAVGIVTAVAALIMTHYKDKLKCLRS